jgi:hypothetical protein
LNQIYALIRVLSMGFSNRILLSLNKVPFFEAVDGEFD